MIFKKYKIINSVIFRRIKTNYIVPCISICKSYNSEDDIYYCKYLYKTNEKGENSMFDLCVKACNKAGKYDYIPLDYYVSELPTS